MANNNLNISLYPMEIKWDDPDYNLKKFELAIDSLHPQTDILILPETFSTGYPVNADKDKIKNKLDFSSYTDICERLKKVSKKSNTAIIGSVIAEESDKFYNRAFFIEPSGEVYFADKRHLFSMAGEDKVFHPGSRRMKVRFRGWEIALVVCYDIRFPVWCRNRDNEYDLLITIANWPESRIKAWEKLLPARAIENEAYVAGVNCSGTDPNGIRYNGSSEIFDFKGEKIGKQTGDFIYASLDHKALDRFREKFPAWRDADQFSLLK